MIANTYKNQYKAYVSATHTVGKTQQIIMLYEGTIRLMQQARDAIEQKRIEDRFNLLIKASTIIQGMQGCLDFENGKEIAGVLYSFYSNIDNRIFALHRASSVEACDAIIDDLRQMRDAWVSVDTADMAQGAPAQAAEPKEAAPASPQAATDISSIILSA